MQIKGSKYAIFGIHQALGVVPRTSACLVRVVLGFCLLKGPKAWVHQIRFGVSV
jgi:hypothetical protein